MGAAKPERLAVTGETPNITGVRADRDRCIIVTWKGGAESLVDLSQHLSEYAVFAPLRADDDLFRATQVGEWGWCVHWSDDMEISADTLWRLALKQGAAWLRRWRTAHRMTQAEAAKALGVSPRMWRYYEGGTHLLPKTVKLAAFGLDAQAQAA
jgi:hypothetical protein